MISPLNRLFIKTLLTVATFCSTQIASAVIRDGGIDPANLGKGEWIYSVKDATNRLGGHINSVTNEASLFKYYKSIGVRYVIIKMGTSAANYSGCYASPHQVTVNLCNIARTNGVWVFGYTRSYGEDIVGESALVDSVFNNGADGFVFDAEAEWESSRPWIGTNGPALAWQMLSMVRSNWPTKFIGHAPFPIIYFHSSFPYKEFGYFCDAVMPQVYHLSAAGLKGSPSAVMNWMDVNYRTWQNSLIGTSNVINGQVIYWTNSIKPITPLQDVYGEPGNAIGRCNGTTGPTPNKDVLEFIDYSAADPNTVTAGGYKGVNFWRADLHGTNQFAYIAAGTSGDFSNIVNNIVIDDANATVVGGWTAVKVFGATTTLPTYYGATGTDINPFGTNYWTIGRGIGTNYMQYTPNIIVSGIYDILQWHPTRTNASTNVPFVIKHSLGMATNFVNQTTNGGNWSLVGRYNFAAGTNGTISVLDNFTQSNAVAMVDGLKLVYIPVPPAAPSNLVATAINDSQIALRWTDKSTNETGFILGRSSNSGGPYTDVGAVSTNITNYTDSGLLDNVFYYYVVRAQGLGIESTNSPEASAQTPPGPPRIVTQPAGQIALEGDNASFSVEITSSTPATYQWRFNSAIIPGATDSSFTVSNTMAANEGEYSVVIDNYIGSITSAPAVLVFNYYLHASANPPAGGTILASPEQIGYTPADTVNLTAIANPNFLFVGWSQDVLSTSNSIDIAMTNSKTLVANFISTADLIIDNPEASYNGVWTISSAGEDKYGSYYQYASTVSSFEGAANGHYAPNIIAAGKYDVFIWYTQGTNRTSNAQVQVVSVDDFFQTNINQTVGGGSWHLLATGKNFAEGTNGFVDIGSGTGENNKIVVADAVRFTYSSGPLIYSQPQSQTVKASSNATFNVLAASSGQLNYQWQFNGTDISGATDSAYTRFNVQEGDAGDYAVILSNPVETVASDTAVLSVALVVPATLHSVSYSPETGFHFSLNGGSNVLYTIEVSTNLVHWADLTNIFSPTGTLEFTDPTSNASERYYRARFTP